jgi:hypothetical protein
VEAARRIVNTSRESGVRLEARQARVETGGRLRGLRELMLSWETLR